jgi:hypothetical protein
MLKRERCMSESQLVISYYDALSAGEVRYRTSRITIVEQPEFGELGIEEKPYCQLDCYGCSGLWRGFSDVSRLNPAQLL